MNELVKNNETPTEAHDRIVVEAKQDGLAITQAAQVSPMQIISDAVGKGADIDVLEKMFTLYERDQARIAKKEFAEAMGRVQKELPIVLADAVNPQTKSKYAKHERIAQSIKPIYTEAGFSLNFGEEDSPKEGFVRIAARLNHSGGHTENYHLDIPLDDKGAKGTVNKTATHATGSTYTYGRRYLTCMIFDVATGDDLDGNQPNDLVTADQAVEIRDLIKEKKVDEKLFFKWVGAETYETIPASWYDRILREYK